KISITTVLVMLSSVAQPGSASGLGPEGPGSNPATPTIIMKKAIIYI